MSSEELKRRLFAGLPTPLRVQGRAYIRNCLLDLQDYMTGQADPDIPPHRLNIAGEGPFRLYGQTTVDACRELAGLQPDEPFIDLGCGIGRTALALTKFLDPTTPYLGFDVVRFAIEWSQRHIARRHANFRFVHSNVHNWVYNPGGAVAPEQYRFPAPEGQFRFALANSLFTHLGPGAAGHYVAEASRVLLTGAGFLSSWFVLEQRTEADGRAANRFPHRVEQAGYASLHAPEQAVAFERIWIERTFADHGFTIERILFGKWSGVANPIETFQDLVVARKAV